MDFPRRFPGAAALTPIHPSTSLSIPPTGFPTADLRLSFGGRPLTSGASLAAAGVSELSTLEALLSLRGGAKKRKKKTYTKPKKLKQPRALP